MAVGLKSTPAPSVADPCSICCIVVGSVTLTMCPESSYVITGAVRFDRRTGDARALDTSPRRHIDRAVDKARDKVRESMTRQKSKGSKEEESRLVEWLRAHQARKCSLAGGNVAESRGLSGARRQRRGGQVPEPRIIKSDFGGKERQEAVGRRTKKSEGVVRGIRIKEAARK